jgi:hypothetical protein
VSPDTFDSATSLSLGCKWLIVEERGKKRMKAESICCRQYFLRPALLAKEFLDWNFRLVRFAYGREGDDERVVIGRRRVVGNYTARTFTHALQASIEYSLIWATCHIYYEDMTGSYFGRIHLCGMYCTSILGKPCSAGERSPQGGSARP